MPIKKRLNNSLQSNRIALLVERNYGEVARLVDEEIGQGKLSLMNITNVVIAVMKYVESLEKLSGGSKKQMVISLVSNVIQDKVEDEEMQDQLLLAVSTIGPSLIDNVVALANGSKTLEKVGQTAKKVFSCCQ